MIVIKRLDLDNEVSLFVGVTRVKACVCQCVWFSECVFVVACDTLCHHDTFSQGHAIIIAASDSIMIQFYLLHRGQEVQRDIRNG